MHKMAVLQNEFVQSEFRGIRVLFFSLHLRLVLSRQTCRLSCAARSNAANNPTATRKKTRDSIPTTRAPGSRWRRAHAWSRARTPVAAATPISRVVAKRRRTDTPYATQTTAAAVGNECSCSHVRKQQARANRTYSKVAASRFFQPSAVRSHQPLETVQDHWHVREDT